MPIFTIRVDHYIHPSEDTKSVLASIAALAASLESLKGILMTTQSELAQQLTDLAAQTDKAKAEVIAKVAALEEALANAGNTTPEVDAAVAALKAAVQGVDDLNPDA